MRPRPRPIPARKTLPRGDPARLRSAACRPKRKAADPAVQIAAATVAAGYNPDFKRPPKKEKPAEAAKPAADEGRDDSRIG